MCPSGTEHNMVTFSRSHDKLDIVPITGHQGLRSGDLSSVTVTVLVT